MSTRIIIEKDGERLEVASDYVVLIDDYGHVSISNLKHTLLMNVKKLPPVIRTDNSAKCDCKDCSFRGMELCEHRKMIDDNAKLREALKPIIKAKCPKHKCLDQKFKAIEDAVISGSTTIATEMEYDDGIDGSVLFHYGDAAKYIVACVNAVRKAQEIMKGEKK